MNKTIYVRHENIKVWEMAVKLYPGNVSELIFHGMQDFIALQRSLCGKHHVKCVCAPCLVFKTEA